MANPSCKTNGQLLKAIHEGAVLKAVRDNGPLSRAEISEMTGLTAPTVSSLLQSLAEQGVIRTCGIGESTGGRKPVLFEFHPGAAVVVGVDVGATKMAGGLTNLAGQVLARETITRSNGPADSYERLSLLIERLLAAVPAGVPVRGIGLGVAGVTRLAEGTVTLAPGLGWSEYPLGRLLEQRFGLPVFLDNDVNAILLGECWFGVARGERNVLCMAVGTGIGAALSIEGRLYRGANDAAGEVGYVATDRSALSRPPVTKGAYGFLEGEAAGPGIARRGSEALGRTVTAPEVFRLAAAGDAAAQAVVAETASHLGLALANMVCLINPELVVLTGGVMRSGDQLIGPIRQVVERLVPYPPRIVLSELKEEAGILGGVALVLEAERRSLTLEP